MNFEFSDDQRMLKDQARRFLEERSSAKAVRAVLDTDKTHDADLWRGIVEMGWTGTAIPEAYGGVGLGHLELCVLAEELGRAAAPVPFSSSVYLATEALLIAGSEAQKRTWLPRLATEGTIGTLAVSEGPKAATPANLSAHVEGGKLFGAKAPVADGTYADFAIVLARCNDDPTERSASLYLVDLSAAGVSRDTLKTVDMARDMARLSFDGAAAELVGAEGDGWSTLRRVFDRAAVLFAFEQVGGADAALEMARDYAMGRYAFGRLIASFQALKHKMADMYIKTELARSNAYYGAWALSTDSAELPVAAAAARVSATEAFDYAAQENIQIHGGMGFTWEFDCHLYLRRAKMLALAIGSQRSWKDRLITLLEMKNAA